MRRFDYGFLNNGLLPSSLVGTTAGIYSLRSAAASRKELFARAFSEMEQAAKIRSVRSSNAIEGIVTSDRRIREIVSGESEPLTHDEREIAGYRDALNAVSEGYEDLDFRVSDILALHRMLMSPSGAEDAGRFKDRDNVIVEIDGLGRRSVRFRPTPAAETAEAMEQLELAYMAARSQAGINGLLLIPCVILDFLCIHPFRDGNGRISRLLSLLLLYKSGFDAGKYVSFEEQIDRHKEYYYEALRRSSQGWAEGANDYAPFMTNFLQTLYGCYQELDQRFAVTEGKKVNKTSRVEAAVLGSLLPVSKADICAIHPDISPTTVEAVLGRMVKEGRIRKVGSSRSTRYVRV